MTINSETFVKDILSFIKTDLTANITDPISTSRPSKSKFIMTSYPLRETAYPLITLKITNYDVRRAGMQTTTVDIEMDLEVRIWARNVKERDEIFTDVLRRLQSIQYSAGGSVAEGLHDFNIPSNVEIDEDKIKSKVMNLKYKFYDL